MFLIRNKGNKKSAHYWNGNDTVCRLWSTGGMNQKRGWTVHTDRCGFPICTMCAIVRAKQIEKTSSEDHRHACEVRAVIAMRRENKVRAHSYLAAVGKKRGPEAEQKLRDDVMQLWGKK